MTNLHTRVNVNREKMMIGWRSVPLPIPLPSQRIQCLYVHYPVCFFLKQSNPLNKLLALGPDYDEYPLRQTIYLFMFYALLCV